MALKAPLLISLDDYAASLARSALLLWEPPMTEAVKNLAQERWGEESWFQECQEIAGGKLEVNVTSIWDLNRLTQMICRRPDVFYPPALAGDDKEMHR